MKIDALGHEPHFTDHVASIVGALPVANRGRIVVPDHLVDRVRYHGLTPGASLPREQRPVIVSSYGDLRRARRAGRTRIVLIEHGIGQSFGGDHTSYPGGRDRGDVGLYLAPNEHAAQRVRNANPDTVVEIVGSPRIERLPARESHPSDDGRPVIALSFHWQCGVSLETRSAFRHYRRIIGALSRRYHVIGHGHPRMQSTLAPIYDRAGIEMVPDFDDVCRRADLYVCDGVSTLYEFASTGRPVVVLNAPWYRKRANHGLRYWAAADVGVQVDHPRKLFVGIDLALKDLVAQRRAREAALDIVYAHRSGAAERAAAAILSWAAGAKARRPAERAA
ncbi:MAG TPA: hypothetical protein VEW95_05590 [Candidatus Limnocylindrales bacterium]|nr:hypothetical protein [Candidatus Limnocylindrales bacterium]